MKTYERREKILVGKPSFASQDIMVILNKKSSCLNMIWIRLGLGHVPTSWRSEIKWRSNKKSDLERRKHKGTLI